MVLSGGNLCLRIVSTGLNNEAMQRQLLVLCLTWTENSRPWMFNLPLTLSDLANSCLYIKTHISTILWPLFDFQLLESVADESYLDIETHICSFSAQRAPCSWIQRCCVVVALTCIAPTAVNSRYVAVRGSATRGGRPRFEGRIVDVEMSVSGERRKN